MIIKDSVIFILGIAKFDGPFESTSFTTAKFLARDNDVYYIDYPYTIKDYYAQSKMKDAGFEKRKQAFMSSDKCLLDTDIPRLKILIVPPLLSINFLPENKLYRFFLGINENLITGRIKSVIKARNIKKYIFINSYNFHYPGVGPALKPALSVYHCVDPLIVPYDRKHGIISERRIVEKSDLVICTSKQLYIEKKVQNSHTYFIPNAADLGHSSKALDKNLQVHSSLLSIPKPIIGYFGNIERRMDYQILEEAMKLNPDKSFVFAGPVSEEYLPENFRKIKNAFFIGRIPYEEMPAVLKGFDVALIPFKKDEVSATIFPLKLFEYLGTGKPVVATDFNLDLKDFTYGTITYCSTANQFTKAIEEALHEDTAIKQQARLNVAAENTWDKRLNQLSELVNGYYEKAKE